MQPDFSSTSVVGLLKMGPGAPEGLKSLPTSSHAHFFSFLQLKCPEGVLIYSDPKINIDENTTVLTCPW